MATKIFRDLGHKGSLTISLKDEDLKRPVRKKGDVLDLSSSGKQKFVITRGEKGAVKDLAGRAKKDGEVFFFQIEPAPVFKPDLINEVIRVAAAGIMILFVINCINIVQRGVVIKDSLIASAASGYQEILQGGQQSASSDYQGAQNSFDQASADFNRALQNISFLQTNRDTFFAREKTVDSVQGLLEAAKNISAAGTDFSRGIENLRQLPALFFQYNKQAAVTAIGGANGQNASNPQNAPMPESLTKILKADYADIEKAGAALKLADQQLSVVSPDVLPPTLRDKLASAQQEVKKLLSVLDSVEQKMPALLDLLGDRYPQRYLVLLQNDSEARPTGGFIGSFIIVDINDGYITKMEFHDVYDYDGQLKEDIPAPEDIAKISKNWRLRDSNYSPDYTVSAEKAAWFLQEEKGPSVDSVIAVNSSVVADLLGVTGPVKLDKLNAAMDKDNFQTAISYIIESKLSGQQNPKQILGDFIAAFQKKLFASENWKKTVAVLIDACRNKSILFYSRNDEVQSVFDELGFSGRVIATNPGDDYLDVITTSIGGNKSDLYMSQSIQHNTLVNTTGLLIDDVTVTRKHGWNDDALTQMKSILKAFGYSDIPDWVVDIMGRGTNKSYVKIYVPKGSLLLDAAGMDKKDVMIRNDDLIGKTYFMFEMNVAPSTEKKVTISYQLPQNLNLLPADTYRFYVQPQPGLHASTFVKQVFFKPGLQSYKQYPQDFAKYENGDLYYSGKLDSDVYLSAVVGG